jgi:Tol biopolymer transport system component
MRDFTLLLILAYLFLAGCEPRETDKQTFSERDWRYFGQMFPETEPKIYSPGIISTERHERDFAMSPGGSDIFYSYVLPRFNRSVILSLHHDGAFWSDVKVASFSGAYNDLEPAFSPDGNRLFFVSKRPASNTAENNTWGIWYIEKTNTGWGEAIPVGVPVDSTGNEFYPSVSATGNLYFTAERENGLGGEDIFVAEYNGENYSAPLNLGAAINSRAAEFNAFIAPDESYLIFSSYGREDDLGGGDLYIAFREPDGSWGKARNMGPEINSDKLDYCPFVSPDNRFLFFTSERTVPDLEQNNKLNLSRLHQLEDRFNNGLGDIYWVQFNPEQW